MIINTTITTTIIIVIIINGTFCRNALVSCPRQLPWLSLLAKVSKSRMLMVTTIRVVMVIEMILQMIILMVMMMIDFGQMLPLT